MSDEARNECVIASFLANRARLYRIAYSIVRKREVAEDICQDAFVRLLESSSAARAQQPERYCSQVIRNIALDYCRRQKFERIFCALDDGPGYDSQITVPSPYHHAEYRASLREVDRVLDRLPAPTRKAFELHRVEGLTQREIASQLGRALGAVNGLVADASRSLEAYRYLVSEA